jgi:predicted RNase H-like HicB family nuclease
MKKAAFRDYTVVVEQDEDGFYVGEVVELPGCHTQAKTVEALMERMKEAVALCLEVSSESKAPTFVGLQKIRVPVPSSV